MTDAPIRWLGDVPDDRLDLAGGKGTNLARLLRLGLPVPPGFVVTTAAYRAFLIANGLADAGPEELRARIPDAPLPAAIADPLLAAYRALGAGAVAVRSSGTAEDLAAASFAGQHDTFLNIVGPEALLAAVRACWASLWSPRAVEYRRQHGWDERGLALAVVVQAMAPAECAGVLFTADPVSGRRDRLVVEAVAGLGEALVSGEASGRRYVVEKDEGRVPAGDGLVPGPALAELARLGRRIEAAFGRPQDIEWAYADGRVAILQARPLTALPEETRPPAPDGRRYSRFQRNGAGQILERTPVPPYPFDYALFYRPLMGRVLAALESLGFAVPPLVAIFVEVADGVVQIVPPTLRPTPRALTLPARLLAALRSDPEDWLATCRATLVAEADRIDAEDLTWLSERELLDRIETLQRLELDLFLPRFGYLMPRLIAGAGFPLLLRLAASPDAPRRQADLLAAVPCVTTAANEALARLARRIRAAEDVRAVFLTAEPVEIPTRLRATAGGDAVLAAVDAYLRRYGRRETTMPGSASPAWRDDPGLVYGLLKGLVAAEGDTSEGTDGGERVERALRATLPALSRGRLGLNRRILRPLFLRSLVVARRSIAFREDSHFYLLLPSAVIRRLALELGRRLTARGALDAAEDIFYLGVAEIAAGGPAAETRERVRRRQAARREAATRYPPVPAELLERAAGAGDLRGAPASPGRAVGRARVILREQDFWRLRPGEVLVAPYTNPTWTPLFAVASAVVVDVGGMASHAAIVAREYGIPGVVGTRDATSRIPDGSRVRVDGQAGLVTIFE